MPTAVPTASVLSWFEFNYHFTGETDMRAIGLLFLLGTLSNAAIAQTSECDWISKASDREACLDRAPLARPGHPVWYRGPAVPEPVAAVANTPSETPLQTPVCQSISGASARQACYDKTPPAWVAQHAKRSGSKISAPSDQDTAGPDTPNKTPLADVLAEENSKLNTKLKTICRGC